MSKKIIYEDDFEKVFDCGCRETKLEPPTGKDRICETCTDDTQNKRSK